MCWRWKDFMVTIYVCRFILEKKKLPLSFFFSQQHQYFLPSIFSSRTWKMKNAQAHRQWSKEMNEISQVPTWFATTHEPLQVFPGDSHLSRSFVLETLWIRHTYSRFYYQCGTIVQNEVLFPSMNLGASWLQMLLSLSPIISCLIEDNIIRQRDLAHHSASMACSVERADLF